MAQAFAGAPPAPFALNYTRKRPLRGHRAPPLHETDQSSLRPLGLTSWTFIVILIAEMDLLKFYRRLILLFREYYKGILFLTGNFL